MKLQKNIALLNDFERIYHANMGCVILTGSLALILHEKITERECSDIDIVTPFFIDLSNFGDIKHIVNPYTNAFYELTMKDTGTKVHVMVDSTCRHTSMQVDEVNAILKVSNYQDIFLEKFRSFLLFNTNKNKKDIEDFFRILDGKPPVINPEDDLPF